MVKVEYSPVVGDLGRLTQAVENAGHRHCSGGFRPARFGPRPDGQLLYVANAQGTTQSVIEAATRTNMAEIEAVQNRVQVGFSPDGDFVYVSLNGEDVMGEVKVATRE